MTWRKSTYSAEGNCVEVAEVADRVLIRNSNHPDAGTIAFPRDVFAGWVAALKADA